MTDYRDCPIEDLELSGRTHNALKRAGIETIGDLMDMMMDDFICIRGIGNKGISEILNKLDGIWRAHEV